MGVKAHGYAKKRARHKYGAKRTSVNGRSYDSKAEAAYAAFLADAQKAGSVLGWIEQVPFRLPGTTYRADFLIFWSDGQCSLVDVKGMETETFKVKKRAMAEVYPWIPLHVVKGPGQSVREEE